MAVGQTYNLDSRLLGNDGDWKSNYLNIRAQ
jgi:hypothetical protein